MSRASYALPTTSSSIITSEGLRPSDSPTRSLARRFAGALRFRLRESYGGRAEAPAARRRARGSLADARSQRETIRVVRLFYPVPRRVARTVSLVVLAAWVVTMGV